MGHPGGQAHQHRDAALLGIVVGGAGHLVGFLLIGRLKDRHHGKCAVEAGILLVLGAVHGRVVAGGDDQAAVGSRHRRPHKGICAHVEPNVLEAYQGAFAGIGHAQGFFHCRFFVGRPVAVHLPLGREGMGLDILGDFRRGGAGVCIYARKTRVEGAQSQRLISQE